MVPVTAPYKSLGIIARSRRKSMASFNKYGCRSVRVGSWYCPQIPRQGALVPRLTPGRIAAEFAPMSKPLLASLIASPIRCLLRYPTRTPVIGAAGAGGGRGHWPWGGRGPMPVRLPNEIKPVWKTEVGEGTLSAAVAGERVFFMEKWNE